MKYILVFFTFFVMVSCKQKSNTPGLISNRDENVNSYPESLQKIFEAHGGLSRWKGMRSLEFTMYKPDGDEVTLVDLKQRKSLISMPKHNLGFDGNQVWLENKDTVSYNGNPKFYYNLMFYFIAMPFVLADDGISYSKAQPLNVDDKTYPGIKISYANGVGESSDDNYILYFDETTHKMVWLAYTVTYFSKAESDNFNFIKYNQWQEVNGLLLPKELQWYRVDQGKPITVANKVDFGNVNISEEILEKSVFQIPDNATIVK
ncbi:DUF6503 family protein [Aestuariibaculum sediminum]|uniref:Threonine synthase n=1 Tax=Aestuariibaculum sediminum TaxID=2770637 RepID=A0A8J6U8J2_9FLAO|nr:DUF6503 family protein [Aestuariibaculum sediminum]MBD0833173.1 hypothetical protein [Aestuariibaculum sediminum]